MRQIRLVLATLLLLGSLALAASGGGFGGSGRGGSSGGGGFGGRSGGGYSGGGGYYGGGGYVPIPIPYGGGYGGYGFGGGGGGGLIGLLVVGGIIVFAVLYMRRSLGGRGLAGGLSGFTGAGTAQAVSVQLLLSEGDEVKAALQQVAAQGDPDSDEGLARMLNEAALVALRHPERWTYGAVERASGDGNRMGAQVGFWATNARSAFSEQTTSNYQNQDLNSGYTHREGYQAQQGGLYLAVTVAVAAWNLPPLPQEGSPNAAELRAALSAISGVNPADLIRAEVVWSPDAPGEFLSEDEAIQKYPRLTKI